MNTNAVLAYRKGWKALNTMLEEGKSYSGFERNSAFLNLGRTPDGEPRFADISGASGLHVLDDGRSIGVVDWDADGKLDFWVTNRTAPRLRLQHNRSVTSNSFVALKLTGTTANRGAIGARVAFIVNGERRLRTLRAGEGFLAQSSTWIHCGLKEGEELTGVEVRWPGSFHQPESIAGVQAGGFFLVEEGSGTARAWQAPAARQWPVVEASENVLSQRARIVMASRLPFPRTTYISLEGEDRPLVKPGQPRLINLWASWCTPCLTEMRAWTDHAASLRDAGVDILALSVDSPDAETGKRLAQVNAFLEDLHFPFEAGLAGGSFLETLEVAGRAQIDQFESFPLPSSLLLDADGRMAVIYKGPVTAEQLIEDMALLDAGDMERRAAAAHFPGFWIEGPWPATPAVMLDKFLSFGKPEEAKAYLDAFTVAGDQRSNAGLAESYFLVANELRIQGKEEEALRAYAKTLELDPENVRTRLEMGTVLFTRREFEQTVPHLRTVVEAQPEMSNSRKMLSLALIQTGRHADAVPHLHHLANADPADPVAHLWLGHALVRVRKPLDAVTQFRTALRLRPDSVVTANELAWLLATHSSATIRRPQEALELARNAAESTKHRQPAILDTLAAAQAATGDLDGAMATLDRAIRLTESTGDQRILTDLQRRRAIYKEGRPYREVVPAQ